MKKSTRDIIFLLFFSAFFISAPLLIFYSMGFRYNIKKNKIESVGALYINALPKDSTLYLNGKKSLKTLPAKIVNLSPQNYTIKLEKNGYHSWKKTLPVRDKKTTFAQNIFLYKKSSPQITVKGEINIFKPSPQNNKILFSKINDTWEELWILNTSNNETKLIYRIPFVEEKYLNEHNLTWSSQGRYILTQTPQNTFIIDTQQTNTPLLLQNLLEVPAQNLHWDNRNDSVLYAHDSKNLYKISIDLLTSEKIYSFPSHNGTFPTIHNYHIKNGFVYYIISENKTFKLFQDNIAQNDQSPKYLADFDKPITKISHLSENYFSLHSKNQSFVFDTSSEIPYFFIIQSPEITYNSQTNQIAYFNDFEIWTQKFLPDNQISDPQFITRYSDTITQILWDTYSQYIIFNNHKNSFAIEQDKRNHQNSHQLVTDLTIKKAALNATSELLYFYAGSQDNQEGIYSITLHEPSDLRNLFPRFSL